MAKVAWKGGTLLAPVPPALISCSHGGKDNLITVAWTGILNSNPPKTYISLRPERFSYELIKESGEFVINLPSAHLVRSIDFCGVKSGRTVDKFAACRLTREPASQLSCPMVAESPVSIECRVTEIIPLGSHDMFMADIVAVNIGEQYIDETGKFHIEKCALAAYAHGQYFALGKKIGSFGYSVKKKKTKKG
ncbi:MAG: flavin reductase family protein [Ruminococcaceae bacterium]|nr:flavin reductase family protein [Oscillospiraceae bacterium]